MKQRTESTLGSRKWFQIDWERKDSSFPPLDRSWKAHTQPIMVEESVPVPLSAIHWFMFDESLPWNAFPTNFPDWIRPAFPIHAARSASHIRFVIKRSNCDRWRVVQIPAGISNGSILTDRSRFFRAKIVLCDLLINCLHNTLPVTVLRG